MVVSAQNYISEGPSNKGGRRDDLSSYCPPNRGALGGSQDHLRRSRIEEGPCVNSSLINDYEVLKWVLEKTVKELS